jgi:glyoxylase-like metal-dependent hydrolase (beta-lactamase superfamily II)
MSMEREVGLQAAAPTRSTRGHARDIAPGLAYMLDRIVNLYFVGEPGAGDGEWTLVDAGMMGSAPVIAAAAEERFGSRPAAIVLTHCHFDHVGALETLARRWDVPVYAHPLELPYITGRASYPPPDPTVGGGGVAFMSRTFPRGPWNVGARATPLPEDNTVPGMPGWRWIPAPGHSPGQVAFFRDTDRALIAGDAFVTTKQESLSAALTQRREIHGPPSYFTQDWDQARISVERLAALRPSLVATGHGVPMRGDAMLRALGELAANFDELARPKHGRYVEQPAIFDERGVVTVPPPVPDHLARTLVGVAAVAAAGYAISTFRGRGERRDR